MEDVQAFWGAVGVAVACGLFIGRYVLAYFDRKSMVKAYDAYRPYAIMAARWVENQVPDDYGTDENDSSIAKATHKLDMFLKKFSQIVAVQEGEAVDENLRREAMAWSVELAERMNYTGKLKDLKDLIPTVKELEKEASNVDGPEFPD